MSEHIIVVLTKREAQVLLKALDKAIEEREVFDESTERAGEELSEAICVLDRARYPRRY